MDFNYFKVVVSMTAIDYYCFSLFTFKLFIKTLSDFRSKQSENNSINCRHVNVLIILRKKFGCSGATIHFV